MVAQMYAALRLGQVWPSAAPWCRPAWRAGALRAQQLLAQTRLRLSGGGYSCARGTGCGSFVARPLARLLGCCGGGSLSAGWVMLRGTLGTVGTGSALAGAAAAAAGLLSAAGLLELRSKGGALQAPGSAAGGCTSADKTFMGWPDAAACSCCDAVRAEGVSRILSARAAASVLDPEQHRGGVSRGVHLLHSADCSTALCQIGNRRASHQTWQVSACLPGTALQLPQSCPCRTGRCHVRPGQPWHRGRLATAWQWPGPQPLGAGRPWCRPRWLA